jgi:hypothetical protein
LGYFIKGQGSIYKCLYMVKELFGKIIKEGVLFERNTMVEGLFKK